MKIRFLPLLAVLTASPALAFGQGSLTPPGAPAPTMKTLNQIEGRTVIDPSAAGFTTPYTISQPGSYYLSGNISVSNGTSAIVISADEVSLDLNGFAINSTSSPAAGYGINITARRDVLIQRGHIRGTTVYSAGAFSGGGFNVGIYSAGFLRNVRVTDVNVSSLGGGISLAAVGSGPGPTTAVERCAVHTTSSTGGIAAGTVVACTVNETTGYGINAVTCTDSYGASVGPSVAGILATTVQNCVASASGNNASGILATTVINSSGTSTGTGTGVGIQAVSVKNSNGYSANGNGIDGVTGANANQHSIAESSRGEGVRGLVMENATNCSGIGTTGTGLSAQLATNSTGDSTSGIGLRVELMANNCRGISSTGGGLSCGGNASNCFGSTANSSAIGVEVGGTANVCAGQNTAGGTAIKAFNGIGCTFYGGTSGITNKLL